MDWFAIKRARALILLDFDFNISFRAGKVVWTFEKRVPGRVWKMTFFGLK